jgi:CRP-like cAMP-binding protein
VGLWTGSAEVTRAKLVNLLSVTLGGSIGGQPWKVKVDIGQAKAREKDIADGPATRPGMSDHRPAGPAAEPSFGYAECREVTSADEVAEQPETHGYGGRRSLPRISDNENSSRANFWDSLQPNQREVFMAMADRRVFAAGAQLMEEGEHANHVVVILDGWTEIRVKEQDGERVVARRGPGQLVGERAALQVSVRSATVVAIQPVDALVVHTEDFAAFVSDYPGVLNLVENQIFSRLRERPAISEDAGYEPDRGFGEATAAVMHRQPENNARTAGLPLRRQRLIGENCTVLRTDVVAFGADERNDEDRVIVRRTTMAMTQRALGTTRDLCWCEDRGDGYLIVAPPSIPTAQAMQGLLAGLARELRHHNRIYSNAIQVRLRVAVDVGPVTEDFSGVSGKAIIAASRMLDAPALKEAMDESDAVLGIVVSPFVYETAIRQGSGLSGVAGYHEILVEVKETRAPAWMHLIAPSSRGDG